jgi:hypothetical protein
MLRLRLVREQVPGERAVLRVLRLHQLPDQQPPVRRERGHLARVELRHTLDVMLTIVAFAIVALGVGQGISLICVLVGAGLGTLYVTWTGRGAGV